MILFFVKKYRFIIIAFVIALFIFAFFHNSKSNQTTTATTFYNAERVTYEKPKCEAFIKNYNVSKVIIDGVTYPRYVPKYMLSKYNFTCLNENKQPKVILVWNKFWNGNSFDYGYGLEKPFKHNRCPVFNCEITNDRSRLNESSLILFHMPNKIDKVPETRNQHQKWVFVSMESPFNYDGFESYNNLFNLSATYRSDSDFSSIYSSQGSMFTWKKNESFNENHDYTHDKTSLGAILLSNCHDSSGRLRYIHELNKYIDVSVYGKCGEPCPKSGDCREILAKRHKFFFAFENSICKDYISEKFFQTLFHDTIPVVYGGGNYDYYVPKSGYINVLDFQTPKHLANYLHYLNSNKTAYNSYFKWKKYVQFGRDFPQEGTFCEMCLKLNLDSYKEHEETHTIKNMKEFWSHKRDCWQIPLNYVSNQVFKLSPFFL